MGRRRTEKADENPPKTRNTTSALRRGQNQRPCYNAQPFARTRLTHKESPSMDRQRILITGGAGFLGINLIRHLEARGYALASLDVEDFDYPERDRVEIIKGDIREKALVNMAMEGVDHVVHTAAALP